MPRRNGTGPTGKGPRTGRGLGPCKRGVRLLQGAVRGLGRRLGRRR